jgi:hypothetical protein
MNKLIIEHLLKYKKKFESEYELINLYRKEWDNLASRISEVSQIYINAAKEIQFWERLFLTSGQQESLKSKNGNILLQEIDYKNAGVVSFGFNRYPVGIGYTKILKDGKRKIEEEKKIETEIGARVAFSQLPNGAIAIIYFYAKSELMDLPDKYFVYKIFDNPAQIKEKFIVKCLKILFNVQLYSSILSTRKMMYRLYMWLIIRKKWKIYFKKIPSLLPHISNLVKIVETT